MVSNGEVASIIDTYPKDRRYALAIMQDMQRTFNYVPENGITAAAEYLDCSIAQLYSMATFYKALSLKPKGRHIIKVCDGTACHLRGANNLVGGVGRELGIAPGEVTPDGEFSLELVNCLGSCALAPVLVIDGVYHNKVKLEAIPSILKEHADAAMTR
jgi:NADH:ubiquinone oxidoreductase subunit E